MKKLIQSIIYLERRGQDPGSFAQKSRMPDPTDSSQKGLEAGGLVAHSVTKKYCWTYCESIICSPTQPVHVAVVEMEVVFHERKAGNED